MTAERDGRGDGAAAPSWVVTESQRAAPYFTTASPSVSSTYSHSFRTLTSASSRHGSGKQVQTAPPGRLQVAVPAGETGGDVPA